MEDLEDEKISHLQFIELNACNGGCVGGVLNVENPYVAKAKLKHLNKYLPVSLNHLEDYEDAQLNWDEPVEYEPVFRLGNSFSESISMLNHVEQLCSEFPGLDCGACGAPTCRALAEDIVRGDATKDMCIPVLKSHIHRLSDDYSTLMDNIHTSDPPDTDCIQTLQNYIRALTEEIAVLDSRIADQNNISAHTATGIPRPITECSNNNDCEHCPAKRCPMRATPSNAAEAGTSAHKPV